MNEQQIDIVLYCYRILRKLGQTQKANRLAAAFPEAFRVHNEGLL